jgi:hypothetical protein
LERQRHLSQGPRSDGIGWKGTGAFCEFYEEQVRYAFRTIADGREGAYLWDDWDGDVQTSFEFAGTCSDRST